MKNDVEKDGILSGEAELSVCKLMCIVMKLYFIIVLTWCILFLSCEKCKSKDCF